MQASLILDFEVFMFHFLFAVWIGCKYVLFDYFR